MLTHLCLLLSISKFIRQYKVAPRVQLYLGVHFSCSVSIKGCWSETCTIPLSTGFQEGRLKMVLSFCLRPRRKPFINYWRGLQIPGLFNLNGSLSFHILLSVLLKYVWITLAGFSSSRDRPFLSWHEVCCAI